MPVIILIIISVSGYFNPSLIPLCATFWKHCDVWTNGRRSVGRSVGTQGDRQLVPDLRHSHDALQQSQEVLCMSMVPVPFKTTMRRGGVGGGGRGRGGAVKHVRVVCHNVSGRAGGQEEVCATVRRRLNGNSWHRRRQLTTRTITYWTKKPNGETT